VERSSEVPPSAPARAQALLDLGAPPGEVARRVALIAGIVLALAFGLVLLWRTAQPLWVLFAGVLLAVVLDAAASLIGRVLPLSRRLRLVLVILALAALLGLGLWWGGATLYAQANELLAALVRQYRSLVGELQEQGISTQATQGLVPNLGAMVGGATRVVTLILGGATTFFVIFFLGAFFAWHPAWYKAPLLSLLPRERRARVNAVLDEAGETLGWWLIGQLLSMATIFVVSLVVLWLIEMPFAFLLAVQAGLLAFIPTLGPAVAGVVIVFVGLSESPQMALWGLASYILIQGIESNLTQPIIQRKTVALPPAFTLGSQVIAGALFGFIGAALAVPALAAASVIVRELYVRDALGGGISVKGVDRLSGAGEPQKS